MDDKYKLLDWIDINKLDWDDCMKTNPILFYPILIKHLKKNLKQDEKVKQYIKLATDNYWNNLSAFKNDLAIKILRENPNKINWDVLSENPNAIDLLNENKDKINWYSLSRNPNAIEILKEYPDKIKWLQLSENPNAIPILKINQNKINWRKLSSNPNAIQLLKKNQDKIDWNELSKNTGAFDIIKSNIKKICWHYLSGNSNINIIQLLNNYKDKIDWDIFSGNPNAIEILNNNLDKINWYAFSRNPNALEILFKNIDKIKYKQLSNNPDIFIKDIKTNKRKVDRTGGGEYLEKVPKTLKNKKQPISATIKRLVWNKYIGEEIGKSKCTCCFVTDITQLSFNCGHIIAEANGGETTVSNLKPICQNCNSSMGTKDMNKFMESLI